MSEKTKYFFVDESGDATFYNGKNELILGQDGCSPILILGLIKTKSPSLLRTELEKLRQQVINNPYFQGIPSLKSTALSFHAKNDIPEIRMFVFDKLKELDFKAEFVVARKHEEIFKNRHKKNQDLFYFDLVSKLFENNLHKNQQNKIYFSKKDNKTRQIHFENAILSAKLAFENKFNVQIDNNIDVFVQIPSDEPCLQIIDYMNWALYRAYVKNETRFLNVVEDKIDSISDIYDYNNKPNNIYNQKNKFDINKISPL
ncbi:MAG: DUF3800 domain-containing protein [bacterium]